MRTFTVSILFLVVLINGIHGQSEGPEKKQICEPGARSKLDCNTCTCSLDGTALGCTRMACPKIPEEYLNPDGSLKLPHQTNPLLRTKRAIFRIRRDVEFSCVPGSMWKEDCNNCFCSSDGRHRACTLMACPLPNN